MRLNENTVIFGDRVILVPYRREHVPRYHEWMQSPELLQLTASEPLTLEEEYEMQAKWHDDEDKLTFILLARPSDLPASTRRTLSIEELRRCRMVGDVNMFMPDRDGDAHSGDGEGKDGQAEKEELEGECEIMIADPQDRRKGYAREALSLFLRYATTHLPLHPKNLLARIGTQNAPSIALFHSLGFETVKVVEVFDEAELRFDIARKERVGWMGIDLGGLVGTYE